MFSLANKDNKCSATVVALQLDAPASNALFSFLYFGKQKSDVLIKSMQFSSLLFSFPYSILVLPHPHFFVEKAVGFNPVQKLPAYEF